MSSYLTSVLRKTGAKVVDKPVNGRPGEFGPLKGIMIHHTGGSYPGDLSVVRRGRSDLPGPLCQLYLAPDGTWYQVTAGRANHAGIGSYKSKALTIPKNKGNAYLIGIEVSNKGTLITGEQYKALVNGVAALCKAYGWSSEHVIGHKEYAPKRKSDPVNNMKTLRADVTKYMRPPVTPPKKGTIMLSDADVERITKAVWSYKLKVEGKAEPAQAASVLGWVYNKIIKI